MCAVKTLLETSQSVEIRVTNPKPGDKTQVKITLTQVKITLAQVKITLSGASEDNSGASEDNSEWRK